MTHLIECVVAGGPRHGTVVSLPVNDEDHLRCNMSCINGNQCYSVAACRKAADSGETRFVLLHPLASGEEFLAMLTLASHGGSIRTH